jgi:hypothetical protein
MGICARNVLSRDPDSSFIIAPDNAEQTGIVGGKLIGARIKPIYQSSKSGIDETLMREASQQRRLPTPRDSAAIRHMGGLVPSEHRPRRVEIVNLRERVLQSARITPNDCLLAARPPGCGLILRAAVFPSWIASVLNCLLLRMRVRHELPASSYTHRICSATSVSACTASSGALLPGSRMKPLEMS